jgi:hypothetical protein
VVHRFRNVGETTARMLDCSLPGGQDHYLKAISDLAANDGFTGEKAMEISKDLSTIPNSTYKAGVAVTEQTK